MNSENVEKVYFVSNKNGPELGYCPDSGVKILEKDGCFFKDLSKDGELHPYEDWRLLPKARAEDLASRLSDEQLAGLMLHAGKQSIPGRTMAFLKAFATFDGKEYDDEDCHADPWELTDQQTKAMHEDFVRAFLMMETEGVDWAVKWNNKMQAFCEKEPFGVPCANSSNPRQVPSVAGQFFNSDDYYWSVWPEALGLAASFDPELVYKYGRAVAQEARALGLPTALAPQIDLATDPRWNRFVGTFGEGAKLSTELARAVCDGMQTTENPEKCVEGSWGTESIVAMPKHWPGGGTGEGGRDAHQAYGKYSVYPGDNLKQQMSVFSEGAFKLNKGTECAAAVMPYYDIPYNQDIVYGENVGNNYSRYIIHDLLRQGCGFDGVVCSDFSITEDESDDMTVRGGNCWGVEHLSVPERFLKCIEAGVDQFGDVMCNEDILKGIQMGREKYGKDWMRRRLEESGARILLNSFRMGLFENPYLRNEESEKIVGNAALARDGMEAQEKSIVLLKNSKVLPIAKQTKVFFEKRFTPGREGPFGKTEDRYEYPIPEDIISEFFEITDNPEEAAFALFCLEGPIPHTGYDATDRDAGGNGYSPITLQYRPYTASCAREKSIAGGDPLERFTNRSYRGKTVVASNLNDFLQLEETRKKVGGKPVVTVWKLDRPAVPSEVEPISDAVLVHFGVDARVMLKMLCGETEPSGLLPFRMPLNMDTVEQQAEDVPLDVECYVDSAGNSYDFAYGMNWTGVIDDDRVHRFR